MTPSISEDDFIKITQNLNSGNLYIHKGMLCCKPALCMGSRCGLEDYCAYIDEYGHTMNDDIISKHFPERLL